MSLERMLPLLVAAMYAATGFAHASKGSWAACGLWMCYGLANIFIVLMDNNQ